MRTSAKGIAFIERHEGVVLKAYRDPVGVWTIGAGLTKASGVVVPKAGMTITKDEARRLLGAALNRNYEPSVRDAMPGAMQREFDGGTSFHFNTGAIGRASWLHAWNLRDWPEVERRIKLWKKGGGRVLPGLVRRRAEEFDLIRWGVYGDVPVDSVDAHAAALTGVPIVLPLSDDEKSEAVGALQGLGYDWTPEGVRAFQADHDLTVDGIVGRATLSTLQRRIDAGAKIAAPAVVGGVGAGGAATDALANLPIADWAAPAVLGLAAIWTLGTAWSYRDAVAVHVQSSLPRLAAWLRAR